MARTSTVAAAALVCSLVTVLTGQVTPASATSTGSTAPTLSSDTVTLLDQPAFPAYFVRDGGTNYDVRKTETGTVADQYGHGPNADADFYETSTAYQNQPTVPGDVKFHAVGDLNGDSAVDVAFASDTGGRTITVLGSQADSFPLIDQWTMPDTVGMVTGMVILGDPSAQIAAEELVVVTTTGLYGYSLPPDNGAFYERDRTPALDLGGSGETLPFGNVLDVFHRPFWDHYKDEPPAAQSSDGSGTKAVDHSFVILYVGDGHVRTTTVTIDTTVRASSGTSLGLRDSVTPDDVVAGRVTYDYTGQNEDVINYRSQQWTGAVVYFADQPQTGRVAFVEAGAQTAPITCDTDLDTHDPANVPDLLSAAVPRTDYNSVVFACVGVQRQTAGPDKLRIAECAPDTGDAGTGVSSEAVAGYGDLAAPQAHLEFPQKWLDDASPTTAGGSGTLGVSTVLRATPVGGQPATLLVSRAFNYKPTASATDVFGEVSSWAYPVAGTTSGGGPLVFARLPHVTDKVTIKVDDPDMPEHLAGQPVPIAVLAAPPTVAGAGQDGSAPTLEKTSGESTTTGSTQTTTQGASAGVEFESPLGIASASVTASIDKEVETGSSTSQDVSFSNSYSGRMDADTLVYETTPQYIFPGTIVDSSTGVGVGTPSFVSIPDSAGSVVASATIDSLRAGYGDASGPFGNLFGPGGYFTAGLSKILTHTVGNPGSYLSYGTDGAAIDDYCLGSLDNTSAETDLPPGPDLNTNPFLTPATAPQKPDILISNPHIVQAGTANQEGAGFTIETGQEDSRVANTSVDLAVSTRVGFVDVGAHKGEGWGSEYTHSLTQGVGFSVGIGSIPSANLGNETYDWRMFLCTKDLTTSDGHSYPIRVLDYAVDGYQGSGGLEPLGPITITTPKQSQYTDLTPTLSWEQDSGTVKSYDWQVEAVGSQDARSGSVTYTDTVDSTKNRPDVSHVTLTKDLLPDQLYRWRVSATDFFGNTEASSWEYFVTQGAPDADFTFDPVEPDITQPVTFTDTSDDGGLGTTAHWTLPDGSIQTGSTITRQFTSSGAYPVTLRVSNSAGSDQLTKIVPVINGPGDDSYTGREDTALDVDRAHGVLANDGAPEPMSATVDQPPADGTLTLSSDGSFSYVPDANFCGTDGFSYLLTDGSGNTHDGAVALDVACVNDAPVATDHDFGATEDAVQHANKPGLLEDATDPDGDTLTPALIDQPAHGHVEVDADGSFTYTPQANFCGPDAFNYAVSDGRLWSNTATATMHVECVNDPPVAADDYYRVDPGGTLTVDAAHGVLANDTDVEDGTASVATIAQGTSHGTVTLNTDGSFSYIPTGEFTGQDSFTYVPGDGEAESPTAATVTITVRPGGGPPSGGGGGASGGNPASGGTTTTVPSGGTASSDPGVTSASTSDPVIVTVTSPNGGTVSFTSATGTVGSYSPLYSATITAPPATADDPLTLTFRIDSSALPPTAPPDDVTMFRDGQPIGKCTSTDGTATPDPCVASQRLDGDDLVITVLSSHASTWVAGIAPLVRVAGANRVATAIAASQAAFPSDHSAKAAVLAREDAYPDALVGGPLAAAKDGPLLLAGPTGLTSPVRAELRRVLPDGTTVYLLGGRGALPVAIAHQLGQMGYRVVRYGGANRYETAEIVATKGLGSPSTVFEATGTGFADALSAAPAAAADQGAILLTRGDHQAGATADYLAAHRHATRYAIGGPAAHADPGATALVGSNRYRTAVAVANALFRQPGLLAFASGTSFPDALSGGASAALAGAPMILVPPRGLLNPGVSGYLSSVAPTVRSSVLYGGPAAVSDEVASRLTEALG